MAANSKIPFITLANTLNDHRIRVNQLIDSVGDVSSMTTAAADLAAAINEHDLELGTITSGAMGTNASTVSTAIAELDGRLDSINTDELLTPRIWAQDSAKSNIIEGVVNVHSDVTLNKDLAVNGGDLTTTSASFNLLNTTALTVNFASAATAINIGSASGTTNIKNNVDIDGTLNVDGVTTTDSINAVGLVNITGDLDVSDSASIGGNASIDGNLIVGGNTVVHGTMVVDGDVSFKAGVNQNITLGDGAGDNVVFNADINSNFIPNTDNAFDLGSASQEWRHAYIDGTANIDNVVADSATIGTIKVSDLTDNRIVVVGTSGELEDDANLTWNGSTFNVTGNTTLDNTNVVGTFTQTGNMTVVGTSHSFTGDTRIRNDLIVDSNFNVGGDFTISGELKIDTQYIELLSQTTGSPSFNAGISVTRGTEDSAVMRWNEDNDYWEASYNNNASTYSQIITAANIDNSTLEFTSGTVNVKDNGVALGTKTTGNYVATIAGTANEVTVTGSGSETAAVTIGLPDNVTVTSKLTSADLEVTDSAHIGGALSVVGNTTIGGNLTVKGTTTTVNSNTVDIGDNILVLNADEAGTPSQNAGIEIERGTATNASLLWNETTDRWTVSGAASGTLAYTSEINDTAITLSAGAGLKTGGIFTTNQASQETITFNIDSAQLENYYIEKIQFESVKMNTIITSLNNNLQLTAQGTGDVYIDAGGDQVFMQGTTSGEQIEFTLADGTQSITSSDALDISAGNGSLFLDASADVYIRPTGDDVIMQGTTSNEQIAFTLGSTTQNITASDALDITATTNLYLDAGTDVFIRPSGDTVYMQGVTSSEQLAFQLDAGVQTITSSDALDINAGNGALYLDASTDIFIRPTGDNVLMQGTTSGEQLNFTLGTTTQTIAASDNLQLTSNGNLTFDAVGDIVLDADGNDIVIQNGAGGDTVAMVLDDNGTFTMNMPGDFYIRPTGDTVYMQGVTTGEQLAFQLDAGTQSITSSDNLDINAGNGELYLDASADVYIRPTGDTVYMQGTTSGEQLSFNLATASQSIIASDQLTIQSQNSGSLYLSSASDVYITPVGDDVFFRGISSGEQIRFNLGATTQTMYTSDNFTLDCAGDMIFDAEGGQITFKDASVATNAMVFNLDASPEIDVSGSFTIDATGDITLDADGNQIYFKNGGGGDTWIWTLNDDATGLFNAPGAFQITTTTGDLRLGATNLNLDASGDIILDAAGNEIRFSDAGTQRGYLSVGTSSQLKWYTGTGTLNTTMSSDDLTVAGDITAFSDERLKTNVEVIPNALEKVSQIRGVTYNRTDNEDPNEKHTGVIAQEVEKVLPEVIHTADDEMETKSVAYGNMVGLLIEAIKELKEEIEELKKGK